MFLIPEGSLFNMPLLVGSIMGDGKVSIRQVEMTAPRSSIFSIPFPLTQIQGNPITVHSSPAHYCHLHQTTRSQIPLLMIDGI